MKTTLLLVDLQGDFLSNAALHPATDPLISQAASLLKGCRKNNIPVIHIWTTIYRENDQRLPHWKRNNRWDCLAGSVGHQTPEPLQPIEGETIIHKSGFNGFASGELEKILKQLNCERIVIAGVYLHTCVRTAAMESLERGLSVVIADDAVASNDPIYAAATRRWLAEREVSFISTYEILSQLVGNPPSKLIRG